MTEPTRDQRPEPIPVRIVLPKIPRWLKRTLIFGTLAVVALYVAVQLYQAGNRNDQRISELKRNCERIANGERYYGIIHPEEICPGVGVDIPKSDAPAP